MAKYHINPETGRPNLCTPEKTGICAYAKDGENPPHYENKDEARAVYENTAAEEFGATASLSKKQKAEPYPEYENEDEHEFWENMRKDIGTIVFNGNEFGIQPKNESSSTIYCTSCNNVVEKDSEYFNKENKNAVPCSKCSYNLKSPFSTGAILSQESLKLLDDTTLKESKWYHTTQNPDWEAYINSENAKFVHLGTLQSAHDRTETLKNDRERPTYLIELEINEDAEISNNMTYEDPYQDSPLTIQSNPEEYEKISFNGITRYINEMEDPGSISLICNPKTIKIKSIKTI